MVMVGHIRCRRNTEEGAGSILTGGGAKVDLTNQVMLKWGLNQ